MKPILFFDLDGTLIDSSHRQLTLPNGSLDLSHWRKNCTRDKIQRDKLLPLKTLYYSLQRVKTAALVICTARVITEHDLEYLFQHRLMCDGLLSRGSNDNRPDSKLKKALILKYCARNNIPTRWLKNCAIYDDNASVRHTLAESFGIETVDPVPLNKRAVQ